MIKISKLLEDKSNLQNEIYKYKDNLQKSLKEKEELENIIENLENEKNNLIAEKENLISNMNHIDHKIKSKGPKSTDMSKRFQNIGQSSMSMIRTDIGLDKNRRKRNQSNMSVEVVPCVLEEKNDKIGTMSAQKLVCTCGMCENYEKITNDYDININEERKSANMKNK